MVLDRFDPGALALLLFALAYFFDRSGVMAALLPAVAAHELGHILALRLGGARLRRLRLGLLGLVLDYEGALNRRETLLSLAAGPLAGALYGVLALRLGGAYGALSGRVSLLLTAYNLLPALPMDGGRMLELWVGKAAARRASRLAALLLLFLGAAALRFGALSLLLSGAWIFMYNSL